MQMKNLCQPVSRNTLSNLYIIKCISHHNANEKPMSTGISQHTIKFIYYQMYLAPQCKGKTYVNRYLATYYQIFFIKKHL